VVELPPPPPPPQALKPPPKPLPVTRHAPYKHPAPAAPPAAEVSPQEAVVAPPAPVIPPAPAPVASPLPSFRALMAAHLERYKRYPRPSQQRGEEGTVMLRFRMDRKGHVLSAQIDQKSGHTLLDEEVLALVRRAEPLPAIPAEMSENELELVVPVKFSLR
jgi:protein TonB